ncbi:aspartate--tRNA ligase [Pseudoscardovia radai]|uniref:aspartate--tRNA ligase n=1 Tax=Pseudoscardovia radai TaxID=987066 RepID=UPI003994DD8C
MSHQTAYRTHHVDEVNESLAGQKVTIAGWVDRRRDHGGVAFLDVRDASGLVQVVVYDEELARPLRSEFVVQVTGDVRLRPEGNENDHLATGKVEIVADTIEVLAKSAALPFQVSTALANETEQQLPGEETRLKYRYLDLRRPQMQANLKLRSDMARAARHALEEMDFTEVETPTFIKSTPEGARDFLVPARLVPGSWYALPQSPQLLKQLLMVSGVERYYQLARCYRDEDFRADRQPEFTQLDMEMSFVDQEDVMAMAEKVIAAIWKVAGYDVQLPIQRISWKDAMDKYGSDKPDLRFGNQLVDLTEYFKNTPFRVFQAPYVGAVVYKGAADLPRRQFDAWQEWARQRGAKGLAYVQFTADGVLKGPVAKNLSDAEREGLKEAVHAEDGDAVFFAAGAKESSQLLLGAARVEIARREGLLDPKKFAFTWVVDFPLFKPTDDPDDDDVAVGHSKWTSMHHPFTMPSKDWIDTFDQDPEHAMSDSYDIVCNGEEMGGGSVRIHRDDIQDRVLKVLGISKEEADEKFGFLLEAFKYGAPPHAGIALGWDRTVSLLAGTDTIRDVIAFPKAGGGRDPLTGAPAPISDEQRAETGVDYDPDEEDED